MKAKFLIIVLILVCLFSTATVRVIYACGNQSPIACLAVIPEPPVTLDQGATFDASGSYDPDGSGGINGIYKFEWDINYEDETFNCDYYETPGYHPDGDFDGQYSYTYGSTGEYTVMVRVSDDYDAKATSEETFDVVKVIYVDDDKDGDGSSWAQAFKELQDAITAASNDDEIWVAEGTYTPGSLRSNSFVLDSGVGFYGGFAGNENGRQGRGRHAGFDDTILSGDIGTPGVKSDNCYHVVEGVSGVTIDGFTITKGYANGTAADENGSGMYDSSTSPIVRNCNFVDNEASKYGGGMYIEDPQAVVVLDSLVFHGNKADYGGGIYFRDAKDYPPKVINCIFYENEATNYGGGIRNNNSSPIITNCTFYKNYAGANGGGIADLPREGYDSWPVVTNCIFWANEADHPPGYDYDDIDGSTLYVTYCVSKQGNIHNNIYHFDPNFVDLDNLKGNDGKWRTSDDGLCLDTKERVMPNGKDIAWSQCVGRGDNDAVSSISEDIKDYERIQGDTVDLGAYESNYHDPYYEIAITDQYACEEGYEPLWLWRDGETPRYIAADVVDDLTICPRWEGLPDAANEYGYILYGYSLTIEVGDEVTLVLGWGIGNGNLFEIMRHCPNGPVNYFRDEDNDDCSTGTYTNELECPCEGTSNSACGGRVDIYWGPDINEEAYYAQFEAWE